MAPAGGGNDGGQKPGGKRIPWTSETAPRNGGRPKSAKFRANCRDALPTLVDRLRDHAGEPEFDTGGVAKAIEVLASHGGYLKSETAAELVLKALAQNMGDDQRRKLIKAWAQEGGEAVEAGIAGAAEESDDEGAP